MSLKQSKGLFMAAAITGLIGCGGQAEQSASTAKAEAAAVPTAPILTVFKVEDDCRPSIANFWRCNEGKPALTKKVDLAAEKPTASETFLAKLTRYDNHVSYNFQCKSSQTVDARAKLGDDEQALIRRDLGDATRDKLAQKIAKSGGEYGLSVKVPAASTVVLPGCRLDVYENVTTPDLGTMEYYVNDLDGDYSLMKLVANLTDLSQTFSTVKSAIQLARQSYDADLVRLGSDLAASEDPVAKAAIQARIDDLEPVRDGLVTAEAEFATECTSGTVTSDVSSDACTTGATAGTPLSHCMKQICQVRQAVFKKKGAIESDVRDLEAFIKGEKERLSLKPSTFVPQADKNKMTAIYNKYYGLKGAIPAQ